ncbi:hypothetical protein PF004_g3031 [Phytophthora fragariae]|uniref:SCP domain-containing protein n=1 Tax=Phytophthora fragariae TaxID=53985 RepID=A0A6G0PN52_9STRA|nr:hypothetical protein PF004_g3031 [Phytophthora fragariae]
MLNAVNAERVKAGLSSLCTNNKLQAAAKRHSDDMAKNNYMGHDGADGSSMSKRVTDAGYDWTAVAENVAAGQEDVKSIMESWMNSPGHRANILSADYTMLGTSYAYRESSTYKHYWTQDFGAGDTEACDSGSLQTVQYPTPTPAATTTAPVVTKPATKAPTPTPAATTSVAAKRTGCKAKK